MWEGGSAAAPEAPVEGGSSTVVPHELMGAGGSTAMPEAPTDRGGSAATSSKARETSPSARE